MFSEFTILVVFLCYAGFAFGFTKFHNERMSKSVFLLGFAYVSDFLLIEHKIGRPSIRIYVICVVFLIVFQLLLTNDRSRSNLKPANVLLIWVLVFFSWTFVAFLLSGASLVSLGPWLIDFLADNVTPQLYFISAIVLLETYFSLIFITWVCLATALISAAVAILQFLNVGPALSVHEILYPGWTARLGQGSDIEIANMSVPGLSLYSIPFAYLITTFGPLSLSYAVFSWKSGRLRSIVLAGAFLMLGISVFVCKSRSGLLAVGMDVILAIVLVPRMYPGVKAKRTLQLVAITCALALMLLVLLMSSANISTRYTDFGRMSKLTDANRVEIAKVAWEEILDHPIAGMSSAEFVAKHGIAPHNAILNAGLYYGIPGMILVTIGYGILLVMVFRMIGRRRITPASWIIFGVFLGSINYSWNGLTHNASLASGGSFLFFLLGIGVAAWNWELRWLQRRVQLANSPDPRALMARHRGFRC